MFYINFVRAKKDGLWIMAAGHRITLTDDKVCAKLFTDSDNLRDWAKANNIILIKA